MTDTLRVKVSCKATIDYERVIEYPASGTMSDFTDQLERDVKHDIAAQIALGMNLKDIKINYERVTQ